MNAPFHCMQGCYALMHGILLYLRVPKSLARPGIDPGTPHTLIHRPNHWAMESTGFRWQFFIVQSSYVISHCGNLPIA